LTHILAGHWDVHADMVAMLKQLITIRQFVTKNENNFKTIVALNRPYVLLITWYLKKKRKNDI
jgi:hypothetical protein